MKEQLKALLSDADALIIVPPFAGLDRPSLGAHILQSCAAAAGHKVTVLYANILLAQKIGEINYEAICFAPSSELIGEKFFAGAAYGGANVCTVEAVKNSFDDTSSDTIMPTELDKIHDFSLEVADWVNELTDIICTFDFLAVGCTTTFEQTSASVAILKAIKGKKPGQITILGGANCEAEMAAGIHSLNAGIDHIFSGECENAFPEFLTNLKKGIHPETGTVKGTPCHTLNDIPTPDYSEYYLQIDTFLQESEIAKVMWLPYESSRGCWWGEKKHCTFCGINGEGMPFREKAPERVLTELEKLLEQHPTKYVCMVDNIMPHHYFRTLLPDMAAKFGDVHMFYEQKANLSLQKVSMLRKAGVGIIQPGIEALSTPLLRLMKKGVTSAQNIALLRYSRTVDMAVNWNLLYAFPGDDLAWYESTLAILPSLHHLSPPTGVCHLSIDRFSPYFDNPEEYGVSNIRPIKAYYETFPENSRHSQIAYHFEADYVSGSKGKHQVITDLNAEVSNWRSKWESDEHSVPTLYISQMDDDACLMVDTRGVSGEPEIQFISMEQAVAALTGHFVNTEVGKWALQNKVCLDLDEKIVPLAFADLEFFMKIENQVDVVERKKFNSVRAELIAA